MSRKNLNFVCWKGGNYIQEETECRQDESLVKEELALIRNNVTSQ